MTHVSKVKKNHPNKPGIDGRVATTRAAAAQIAGDRSLSDWQKRAIFTMWMRDLNRTRKQKKVNRDDVDDVDDVDDDGDFSTDIPSDESHKRKREDPDAGGSGPGGHDPGTAFGPIEV